MGDDASACPERSSKEGRFSIIVPLRLYCVGDTAY